MAESFDAVIVGAGAAGCVVAARLSEDPACSVLLLEAGPDYPTLEATPAAVRDARYVPMRSHAPDFDPSHDWGIHVTQDGATIVVPQARLVGGGSAINGTLALRGATADFREWVEAGNPDWTWDSVLASYRALESDDAPGAAFHGRDGPYPITRASHNELAPLQRAFIDAARRAGAPACGDFNAPDAAGVGAVPQSRRGDLRVSTAIAYLNPARRRPNLHVRGDSLVRRVLFDGNVAIGVEMADGATIAARRVIVCGGALVTPVLLQRSGVGPEALLAEMGIDLVADLPVGERLADHCVVPLLAAPRDGAWNPRDFSLQAVWRFSTQAQPESLDAQLTMFSYLNVRTTGEEGRGLAGESMQGLENVAGIACVNNKPRSAGVVRITGPQVDDQPYVELNYLSEPVDRVVMREIVRRGWQVLTTDPLARMLHDPIGVTAGDLADDDRLDATIAGRIASGYHFAGSCRMAPREMNGVVDQTGQVHGCENLWIIDASVMPSVPAANTMLPTIMVAERMAASMPPWDERLGDDARGETDSAGDRRKPA